MTAHIVTIPEDAHAAQRDLRRRFAGRLCVPGEPGYDEGRSALSPSVDAHPLVVAEAQSPLDVSVPSPGHANGSCRSPCSQPGMAHTWPPTAACC